MVASHAGHQGEVIITATLAGEPLYTRFGYSVVERYEAPLPGGLTIAVVRMARTLPPDPSPRCGTSDSFDPL